MQKTNSVTIQMVHAFGIDGTGGNPAGVVLGADTIPLSQKQQIARRVGLSETVFISNSTEADFKLDFFTPSKQIAHCGHATVAAFSLMKQNGLISRNHSSKETIDGTRNIFFEGEMAFMEQTKPVFTSMEAVENNILEALAITKQHLFEDLSPYKVNTGNAFIVIPLKSPEVLAKLKPNQKAITELSKHLGLVGVYPFTLAHDEGIDAQARMFAPYYGIDEEAATGMAAGPLASYLYRFGLKKEQYTIKQGEFMKTPSPSLIQVKLLLENGQIEKIFAGGTAYSSRKIELKLNPQHIN